MKKGDAVLVPTGAGDQTVEGVIRSVTKTHAMIQVPPGSMAMGRRSTQALRRLSDLEPVDGKPKTSKPKTSKKKTSKKKTSKSKTSKSKTSEPKTPESKTPKKMS